MVDNKDNNLFADSDKKIGVSKNTVNSLVYFYFGFTLDDDTDFILKKIIEKAYIDATNQGAFNTLIPKKNQNDKKNAEIVKANIMEILCKTFKGYDSKCKKKNYDNWHKKMCDVIVNEYKKFKLNDKFTYGNAQKWLNMSIKYLYLISGIQFDEGENKCLKQIINKIEKDKEFAHIPLDSYIIDALWEIRSIYLPVIKGSSRDKVYKTRPSDHVEKWSCIEKYDKYFETQKTLRKFTDDIHTVPMNWESYSWIQIAKKIKNPEDSNND